MRTLKILHVLRAPLGGLFRHVIDLAEGQSARGHEVGIVAASGGSPAANQTLAALANELALDVSRIPMTRQLGWSDIAAVRHVTRHISAVSPDVVHGHGAKGGAYARLAAPQAGIRVYTPHGGSLHYGRHTPQGMIYGAAERFMMGRTDLFLFESAFAREKFQATIGLPRAVVKVVHNGIRKDEMVPVDPDPNAADLLFVGELRMLKGPDVLISAISELHRQGSNVTAAMVGDGPDRDALLQQVDDVGLGQSIKFLGHLPARQAFSKGRLLVVPSRAESLPYIVLEAAGAGLPIIATNVGGIPEIFGTDNGLLAPGNASALAAAIAAKITDPAAARLAAQSLRTRVEGGFSQDAMVEGVLAAYAEATDRKFRRWH
jgi:glycosyltransferase involved in cell wall biosynthesis